MTTEVPDSSSGLVEVMGAETADDGVVAANGSDREFVFARIVDDLYALPIAHVTEVLATTSVTPVPHVPPHVRGVVEHHGAITAVLDLAIFCAKEPESRPRRLVVLSVDELQAAVPVSEILGIHSVPEDAIEPPLPHTKSDQTFVAGQIARNDVVFSVVDVRALLGASRHKK